MLTEMIAKRMQIIDDLQTDLRKVKSLYEESLENDAQYHQIQEDVIKVQETAKEKRVAILENSTYKAMRDQMKELRQNIKENKEALSQDLVDYYKESGVTEIEDSDGNIKHMKFSVKLVN